MVVQSHWCWYT